MQQRHSNTHNTRYLISEWEQIRYIPNIKVNGVTYSLILNCIRDEEYICKTLSIIKSPEKVYSDTLYTFIVETTKYNENIKLLSRQEILNIVNSFGFDIEWTNSIKLSMKEYDILCSLYRLGYNYVQRLRYSQTNNDTYLACTENILSTYDSSFKPKKMQDICNMKISKNDFMWIETEQYISIPTIIGINVGRSNAKVI